MSNRRLGLAVIVLALVYYWGIPVARMASALSQSTRKLESAASSFPDPAVERIVVLPHFRRDARGSHPDPDVMRLLLVGHDFLALDEPLRKKFVTVVVAGRRVALDTLQGLIAEDSLIELDAPRSYLPQSAGRAIEIAVEREGKHSNAASLSFEEVERQLARLRGGPAIVDVVPIEYPSDERAQQMKIRFVIGGLPRGAGEALPPVPPCTLTLDGLSQDCAAHISGNTLNSIDWRVNLDEQTHVAMLELDSVAAPPFQFSLAEFERSGKQRQALRYAYYNNRTTRADAAGNDASLLWTNKNGSLSGLAINLGLTGLCALLFKPWRSASWAKWLLTFIAPVVLHALVGIGIVMLSSSNDGWLFSRRLFVYVGLAEAVVPAVESVVVAIVIRYGFQLVGGTVARPG